MSNAQLTIADIVMILRAHQEYDTSIHVFADDVCDLEIAPTFGLDCWFSANGAAHISLWPGPCPSQDEIAEAIQAARRTKGGALWELMGAGTHAVISHLLPTGGESWSMTGGLPPAHVPVSWFLRELAP